MPPEQTPKKPTATTGPFALLCGLLGVGGTSASKTSRGSGATKTSRRLILSALATTLGALAFTSAPALAAGGHVFKESFNGGAGHEFSDPTGIAVNNVTGDVYVVDKGNSRVEEFNPTGTKLEAEFKGAGTAGELTEPEAIAIDNSGEPAAEDPSVGDVYVTGHVEVAGEHKGVVDKFSASGAYLGQITGTCKNAGEVPSPSCEAFEAFQPLAGVAVDPKGVVWVYQGLGQEHPHIDAFSDAQANAFLSGRESKASSVAALGFAVNSEDDLYVADGEEVEEEVAIAKLNSKGEELEVGLGGLKGKTGVAVEAVSNNVYIDSGQAHPPGIQEFTPNSKTPSETFGEAQLADRGGKALAVSYANVSSGDVYVVDSSAGKVDIFTPPKVTVHAHSLTFGSKGTGPEQFKEPQGVAVNDSTSLVEPGAGDVYVVDKGNDRVEYFSATGEYKGQFNGAAAPTGAFSDPEWVAVDNDELNPSHGDVYVADDGHHVIDKFSATGVYIEQLTGMCEAEGETPPACTGSTFIPFSGGSTGLAVDPAGNLWVQLSGETGFRNLAEFSDTGSSLKVFTNISCEEPGLAVDSSDNVYTDCHYGESRKIDPFTGATLAETTRAFGLPTDLAIEPSTEDLYIDKANAIYEYAPLENAPQEDYPTPLESFPSAGLSESDGIAVSARGTVYATERAAGSVEIFDEYPLPQVAVGAFSSLTPTSVTLQGSVNPEGVKASSCEFEYGTTSAYGQTAECEPAAGSLGEGTEPKLVGAKLVGLGSGTTYHYRLVASSVYGTNRSSDHLFTTPGPSVTEERVTYVEAMSATLNAQIDPHGSATSYHFEYDTSPYTSSASHGTSVPVPSASVGSGTSSVSVSVKVQSLEGGKTYYYRAVAEGAPLGASESFYGPNKTFTTNPAPAPPQNCPNEQLRAEQPFGLTLPDCRAYEIVSPLETLGQDATDSFTYTPRASVSGEAVAYLSRGAFAKPTGEVVENQILSRRGPEGWTSQDVTPPHEGNVGDFGEAYPGSIFTPELTEGIANTEVLLPSSGVPFTHASMQKHLLYLADFASGSYRYVGPGSEALGTSTDLSHIVFEGEGETVSEWVNGGVVPVSVTNERAVIEAAVGSQHENGGAGHHEVWHAVSANGSRVYFTSPGEPTSGADTRGGPGALYVRVNAEQEQPRSDEQCTVSADACTVEVSSAGATGARYWGASANGEKVFYTKEGNLYQYELRIGATTGTTTAIAEGAEVQGVVQISEEGSYVYFVARGKLAEGATAEQPNLYVSHEGGAPAFIATLAAGDEPDWDAGPQLNTAVVNPNGDRLAFLSHRELTGYDNHDTNTGEPDAEIFLYETESDGAGSLVCASCNPTGARPVGPSSFGRPEPSGPYRVRNLLEDGALFFDSSDALVPHTSDGRQNVYEYEDGHVHAISDVAGNSESFFMDASASGNDVFFATADQLLPEDKSNNVEVWDARKEGGFPVAPPPPSCDNADSCKPPESPQPSSLAPTGSATFNGLGDFPPPSPVVVKPKPKSLTRAQELAAALKVCKRDKKKAKRVACERQAKKKYKGAKKSAKRATNDRRASR